MDFYFNKYPDIRNTWFLEFFLHSNLAYSGIYSYANAKYCSLLHKYYLFILQINSTNTVHAGLNLFAGAKAGNSHCTGATSFESSNGFHIHPYISKYHHTNFQTSIHSDAPSAAQTVNRRPV